MSPRHLVSFTTLVLVLAGSAGRALSHAPPSATGLWWLSPPSGSGGERMMVRTPRGFLVQPRGSDELRFLCNEALGIRDGEEPSFADTAGRTLWLGTFGRGLLRADADACRWDEVAAIPIRPAFDIVATGAAGGAAEVFAIGGAPGGGDHFWSGHDEGAAWTPLANSDLPFTRVRVAPGDPSRLYLTGVGLTPTGMALHRLGVSLDAGRTVIERLIPLATDELQLQVLAVAPTQPDRLYLRVESASAELPERLLLSEDAGQSVTTVATLHELRGFAQSDDGRQVWVGGTEGLLRSVDGGRTFQPVPGAGLTRVTCLAFHGNRLYGCGVLDRQLVIAVSDDSGTTFRKAFSFERVTQTLDCPEIEPASAPAAVCASALEHWRAELGTVPTPGSPGATPSRGEPPPAPTGGSSGCAMGGRLSRNGGAVIAGGTLAFLTVVMARRRSSR